MRWFRYYEDSLNNMKVQNLSGDLFKFWINLLCLASQCDGEIPENDAISFHLRVSQDIVKTNLEALIECGLVDSGKTLRPHNWKKRQYKSDTSVKRTKEYRDRLKKNKQQDGDGICDVTKVVAVTPPENRDRDRDTDTDKSKDIKAFNLLDKKHLGDSSSDQKTGLDEQNETDENETEKIDNCPHQKIIDLYHHILPDCPKVLVWSKKRATTLRARWKDYPDLGLWRQFFEKVARSGFLTGKIASQRGFFFASLEWLITESNFIKVLEKQYDNR